MNKKLTAFCFLLFVLFSLGAATPVYATDIAALTFTVTDDTKLLSSGNYCLDDNITLKDVLNISGNVTLDLNGNTLNLNKYYICVQTGATLNICDSKSSGCITGGTGFINDEKATFAGAIVVN